MVTITEEEYAKLLKGQKLLDALWDVGLAESVCYEEALEYMEEHLEGEYV